MLLVFGPKAIMFQEDLHPRKRIILLSKREIERRIGIT